ncbi:MAG: hypothetical protein EI684_00005 [Candidatus Viridilinea halotolerans]|uniref:PLL-like beta propeller domain-containing protein n=1 Tax=Candidatus Viridilinea halotolerans TaxID=2491704 RepID=A0A426UCM5_9CHLR|nr:MAG: hypothetical protein EI684_00005 [Candidatus Viridilinea halotolerans]
MASLLLRRWWWPLLLLLLCFSLVGFIVALRPPPPQVRAAALLAPATVAPAQLALGAWNPLAAMPGQRAEATSTPAVVAWGGERLDLFVRGRNGELYQNYRDQSRWSGWQIPAGLRDIVLRSAPACATWGSERISCVALIEGDRAVWHFYYDGQAWASESLGGDAWSAPAIVSPQLNQLAVFVAGGGGRLYGKGWVPGRWSEWQDFGGELRSAPACAVYRGEQVINCFVVNTYQTISRQAITMRNELLTGAGYVTLAMSEADGNILTVGSAPAALASGPGRITLLVLNRNQNLFQATWAGRETVTWQRINPNHSFASVPTCASTAPGRADCFARGPDSPMLGAFGDILHASGTVQ